LRHLWVSRVSYSYKSQLLPTALQRTYRLPRPPLTKPDKKDHRRCGVAAPALLAKRSRLKGAVTASYSRSSARSRVLVGCYVEHDEPPFAGMLKVETA
jgi:hypothetical protein